MSQAGESQQDELQAQARDLLDLLGSCWKTQAVYVAAELRIADFLAGGPKTADEMAGLTQSHPPALRRLLRALTTIDICRELEGDVFELTPRGALLASDSPHSLRSAALWWGSHLYAVWGQLLHSVRTGESARKLLLGTDGFEHLQRNPALAEVFHRFAAETARLAARDIVRGYDFSGLRRIVDIGGGRGELLAAILQAAPEACGVLFDLSHAVEQAQSHLDARGLAARCEFVVGDFFESVPAGGDVYLLKSVIHDWNDERAGRVLENVRRALGDGRLLLIEEMLPERLTHFPAHQAAARSDLNMLVALAAQERTEAELRSLLSNAGLRVARILPAGPAFTLIEATADPASA